MHLAAGPHQHRIRRALGGPQDVGAAVEPLGRGQLRAVDNRQRLPRQGQCHRPVGAGHGRRPRLGRLVRVGRPDHRQVRNGTQGHQVLHGLVRRAVLPEPNRIVGEHVRDRLLHQGRQPHRRAQVVAKDQEGARVGLDAAVQGHPVRNARHRVLPDSEPDVSARRILLLKVAAPVHVGLVRAGEVRRAADQVAHLRRQVIERDPAGLPGGELFAGGRGRLEGRQRLLPSLRRGAVHPALQLLGLLRVGLLVILQERLPLGLLTPALFDGFPHVVVDPVGDVKRLVGGPAEVLFRPAELLLPEGRSVGRGGADLRRRPVPDVRTNLDQRGPAGLRLRLLDRRAHRFQVVGILDGGDVPAVGLKPGGHVFGERQVGAPVDRNPVVVEQVDQLAEPEVARQRGGLLGDALHQVPVRADGIRVVVDDREALLVELVGQKPLGEGHPDAIGEALPERAGRRLHARRQVRLRVARRSAAPLPEAF